MSPASLACLLIVITFLSFIKLSGSKWSALPFSASVHCLLKIGGGMFASRFPLPWWKSTGLQKLCVSGCHPCRTYSVTLSVQSHLEPVEAHEQAPIWSEASVFFHSLEPLTCMCVCITDFSLLSCKTMVAHFRQCMSFKLSKKQQFCTNTTPLQYSHQSGYIV